MTHRQVLAKILAGSLGVGGMALAPSAFADEQCVLKATTWVQLIVYEENAAGSKGKVLDNVTLGKDQTQTVRNASGRIRYDYRITATDPYHGDVGAWCRKGETRSVP